ncbi:MAG: hypothetical protein U1E45_05670 [Geminicoccaceae bacterium]
MYQNVNAGATPPECPGRPDPALWTIPEAAASRLFGEAEQGFDEASGALDTLRAAHADAHAAVEWGNDVHLHIRAARGAVDELRRGLGAVALAFRGLRSALVAPSCGPSCRRCHPLPPEAS